MKKRITALLLCLVMALSLVPTTVWAAGNWSPDDEITIIVNVFDLGANKIYTDIGRDTVKKGATNLIQSENYQIPSLSKFTTAKYGRVLEVLGNYYAYYVNGANVGTNVVFSCNANTARITYYVSYYGDNSGGGAGGGDDGQINTGEGKYSWQQTIVYHANYPDGTDATVEKTYNIKSLSSVRAEDVLTYDECKFVLPNGYSLVNKRPWNTKADGTGETVNKTFAFKQADKNTVTHLYAQYTEKGLDPNSYYTLNYFDGTTQVGSEKVIKGEKANIMDALSDSVKVFKGWTTTPGGTTATYQPLEEITPQSNMNFYAVWEAPKPSSSEIESMTGAVLVNCASQTSHGQKAYQLVTNNSQPYYTAPNQSREETANGVSEYFYDVTLTEAGVKHYLSQYADDIKNITTAAHEEQNPGTTYTVTLKYVPASGTAAATWTVETPATINVTCNEEEKDITKPTGEPVYSAFGDLVNVICDSTVNHNNKNKKYPVVAEGIASTSTDEAVTDSTTGKVISYKRVVTIDGSYYVENKYNVDVPNHTYKQDSRQDLTIQFNWDGSTWTVDNTNNEATVYATCEPAKPDTTIVDPLLTGKIKVEDTPTTTPRHDSKEYSVIAGSYTIGEVEQDTAKNYVCKVTFTNQPYIDQYSLDRNFIHTDATNAAIEVELTYQNGQWTADASQTVYGTIQVQCATPPTPTIKTLKDLKVSVQVDCDKQHATISKKYGLEKVDEKIAVKVVKQEWDKSQNAWIVTVTLTDLVADDYVKQYGAETDVKQEHTRKSVSELQLMWRESPVQITAVAANGQWTLANSTDTLLITATCTTGGGTNPGTKPGTNPGAKNPYVKDEGKKVESGKTFDAGIALYVGLGILSLTGSAAAIYKRREEY